MRELIIISRTSARRVLQISGCSLKLGLNLYNIFITMSIIYCTITILVNIVSLFLVAFIVTLTPQAAYRRLEVHQIQLEFFDSNGWSKCTQILLWSWAPSKGVLISRARMRKVFLIEDIKVFFHERRFPSDFRLRTV
jgi:hypothetical protein